MTASSKWLSGGAPEAGRATAGPEAGLRLNAAAAHPFLDLTHEHRKGEVAGLALVRDGIPFAIGSRYGAGIPFALGPAECKLRGGKLRGGSPRFCEAQLSQRLLHVFCADGIDAVLHLGGDIGHA